MARGTPGPIIAQLSGTIGGVVFAQHGATHILKPRSITCDSKPSKHALSRRMFALVASGWQQLNDDERLQWDTCAKEVNRRHAARNLRPFSGRSLFHSMNQVAFQSGAGFTLVAPTRLGRPMLLDVTPNQIANGWEFECTPPTDAQDGIAFVYALRSWSTTGFKRRNYVYIGEYDIAGPTTVNVVPELNAVLGIPATEELWSFRIRYWEFFGICSLPWQIDLRFA